MIKIKTSIILMIHRTKVLISDYISIKESAFLVVIVEMLK
jgi:hypothetical protein